MAASDVITHLLSAQHRTSEDLALVGLGELADGFISVLRVGVNDVRALVQHEVWRAFDNRDVAAVAENAQLVGTWDARQSWNAERARTPARNACTCRRRVYNDTHHLAR
jgi:hypothetical protein